MFRNKNSPRRMIQSSVSTDYYEDKVTTPLISFIQKKQV